MSMAPMAHTPSPRRPYIAEPVYSFSHSSSGRRGSSPSSMSLKPRPMQWVLGASINAFTAQGLVSVSPMPTMPASVVIRTTALSWALLQASASTSGTSSTKHSTLVIFTVSLPIGSY